MKKTFSLLLAILMLFALSACAGKPAQEAPPEEVYTAKALDLPEKVNHINNAQIYDGAVYLLCGMEDTETGQYRTTLIRMTPGDAASAESAESAADFTELPFKTPENSNINAMCVASDGTIWLLVNIYNYDEKTDVSNNKYSLQKLDAQGNLLAELPLDELTQKSGTDGYFYIDRIAVDGEGRLYLTTQQSIYVLDGTGKILFDITSDNWVSDMQRGPDGQILVVSYGQGGMVLKPIDTQTRAFGAAIELGSMNFSQNPLVIDPNGTIFLSASSGLYQYDAAEKATEKLLDWIDADISADRLQNVLSLGDGRFLCVGRDDGWQSELSVMQKTKAGEKTQTVLTMAVLYASSDITSAVIRFNKTNPDYRIKLLNYSEYNTQDDYEAGQKRLQSDIIAGKYPDLLETSQLPVKSYAAKGLLEDLYPYLDADGELSRDALVPSVLRSLETGGKLYVLSSHFSINTMMGLASNVGSEMGWTLDEMIEKLDNLPEGIQAFANLDGTMFLHYICYLGLTEFVDFEKGTCNFDNQNFTRLLELAARFGQRPEGQEYVSELTQLKNGKSLLMPTNIYDVTYFQFYRKVLEEDMTFIGFPTDKGNGSAVTTSNGLSIVSRSQHKDGAWAFLRSLVLQDGGEDMRWMHNGFPIRQAALEQLYEEAMTPNIHTDENGNEVEYSKMGIGMDDFMVEIMAATQEDIDQLQALIDSLDTSLNLDQNIINIIIEDAGPFLAGQKTAAEVAAVIQSRVQIYMSESR